MVGQFRRVTRSELAHFRRADSIFTSSSGATGIKAALLVDIRPIDSHTAPVGTNTVFATVRPSVISMATVAPWR